MSNLKDTLATTGLTQSQPQLATLLTAIADCCKDISAKVARGALAGILGTAGTENVQGEDQKKLDVIANDMLLDSLARTGVVAAMASEELDTISPVDAHADAPFLVLFDPLDGSSNIDVNVSIGTIFSVLRRPAGPVTEETFLQSGRHQVAAGYVVYGPQTQLVFTTGQGVNGYTFDPETGEFVLTNPNMRIAPATKEFAINMSNQRHWYEPVQRYVAELLAGKTGPREKDFNMRWIASMVADVHRIMNRGGVFMYPADKREPDKPGKLRLMYEANPMSLLIEQAGGASTNGVQAILDIKPTMLHQRCAVMLGSADEVQRVTSFHA